MSKKMKVSVPQPHNLRSRAKLKAEVEAYVPSPRTKLKAKTPEKRKAVTKTLKTLNDKSSSIDCKKSKKSSEVVTSQNSQPNTFLNNNSVMDIDQPKYLEETHLQSSSPSSNDKISGMCSENVTSTSQQCTPQIYRMIDELMSQSTNDSFVPLYTSSDLIEDQLRINEDLLNNSQSTGAPKRKNRVQHWVEYTVFESTSEVQQFLAEESIWGYHYKNKTESGDKIYYRCKMNKARSTNCDCKLYIFYESSSNQISVFHNSSEHSHEHREEIGIPEDIKVEIKRLFDLKLKPQAILLDLAERGLHVPKIRQLRNYIAIIRKEKYGRATISLGELEAWLKDHSAIPDSDLEPFVLNYEVWGHEVGDEGNDRGFRFFITTKLLLSLMKKGLTFHAYGTYKLIWQGFPIIIVGKSDMNQSFHPAGLSVTTKEETGDYTFVFETIKTGVERLCNYNLRRSTLVCDAAKAIHNAFKIVFGTDITIIMRWFHMKKAFKENLCLCKKENRDLILNDLDKLQLANSIEVFEKAVRLFIAKWEHEKEFMKYFHKQWILADPNWFEGVLKLTPTTNNPLESFNKKIKDQHTLRERLSLAHFLTTAMECVRAWSIKYPSGIKSFADETLIELALWTAAYQWAKMIKNVKYLKLGEVMECHIPADKEVDVRDINFNSFEEFKQNAFLSYKAIVQVNKESWRQSFCNCPAFCKHFMCKHILGILLRFNVLNAPPEAKTIPIGEKRKRGRPSKARKALIIQ